jgi:hypothetical protein
MSNKSSVSSNLTPAQRKFYDASGPGVKATITRKYNQLATFGDKTDFQKWFRNYKKQKTVG